MANPAVTSARVTAVPILAPSASQAPVAGNAAVSTLTAVSGFSWVISCIEWSYGGTPSSSTLTVAWTDPVAGSVSKVDYITVGGPGILEYPTPLIFPINTTVTITLSGVSGVQGSVYVIAWTQ